MAPFQRHISAISESRVPFERHFSAISVPFQRHFSAISAPFQRHFSAISAPFRGARAGGRCSKFAWWMVNCEVGPSTFRWWYDDGGICLAYNMAHVYIAPLKTRGVCCGIAIMRIATVSGLNWPNWLHCGAVWAS